MKIIFSRKGFDSGAGGVPSPITPDGRLLSLPIPDRKSPIKYNEINRDEYNIGDIVEGLTQGKIKSNYSAHLDPDIEPSCYPRHEEWKPIFGQVGPALGHLRNQNVGEGDLFLFFGLFQETEPKGNTLRFKTKSIPKHVIWGWLQVGAKINVDEVGADQFVWANYHPHFNYNTDLNNTLYLSKEALDITGAALSEIPGAGVFPYYMDKLQLTAPEAPVSLWKLPSFMYPEDIETALSYHKSINRWQKRSDHLLLKTVGRGQEFVLDCSYYPNTIQWISSLFQH